MKARESEMSSYSHIFELGKNDSKISDSGLGSVRHDMSMQIDSQN